MAISPLNNTANTNYEHTSERIEREKLEARMKASPNTNPLGQLDKDAFMKLLLQELRYQDPTSPMDSDKMLSQTSQLAALETQEKTNATMEMLAKKMELMSDSMGVGMIGAVGKLASLKNDGYKYEGGKNIDLKFNIYVPESFATSDEQVKITMFDSDNHEVKSLKFDAPNHSGNNNYLFDMRTGEKDEDGNDIMYKAGNYKFILSYTDKNTGEEAHLTSTDFLITGVRMKDGKAHFLAGDVPVTFDDVREFRDAR